MNNKINPFKCFYYLFNTLLMIIFIDKIERYIRLNMGFEINKGSFEELEKEYFDSFKNNGIFKNIYLYFKYKRKFKNISINKETNHFKVASLSRKSTEPVSSSSIHDSFVKSAFSFRGFMV